MDMAEKMYSKAYVKRYKPFLPLLTILQKPKDIPRFIILAKACLTCNAYEELEKEGLIRSVAGKGFYVCEYNTDYLREKQMIVLEERLGEVLQGCKSAGLSKEEILEMVEALLS